MSELGLYYWVEKIEAAIKAAEADGISVYVGESNDHSKYGDDLQLIAYVDGHSWIQSVVEW